MCICSCALTVLLFAHPFLSTNFGTFADDGIEAKNLKLRVDYQNANQNTRKTKIVLAFLNLDGRHSNVPSRLIKSGEAFEIGISNADQSAQIELVFECHVEPLAVEKVPSPTPTNQSDQPTETDQPQQLHDSSELRALIRTIRVQIYKPDFSKLHRINLGSIKTSGLFWHRRVLVETKSEGTGGNYHAFLYAIVRENRSEPQQQNGDGGGGGGNDQRGDNDGAQQNNANANDRNHLAADEKRELLGYAPLIKEKEMAQTVAIVGEGIGTTSGQQKKTFNEYELKIPVNLTHFYRHTIERLELSIFHYDGECKFTVKKFVKTAVYANKDKDEDKDKNKDKNEDKDEDKDKDENKDEDEDKANDDDEDDCPICFNEMKVNEEQIQVHEHESLSHYKCIKEWFEKKKEIRCPFCNVESKPFLDFHFQPIFSESEKMYAHFYLDPLKGLYIIKNAKIGGSAQRGLLAEQIISQISTKVKEMDQRLKILLPIFGFENLEMPLFSIDEEGKFAEDPFLDYIQAYIKLLGDDRGFSTDIETEALALIETVPKVPLLEANNAIEQMQIVVEEEEEKPPHQPHHQQKEQHEHNLVKMFKNMFSKEH
ncbi:hypothetical protein niasHT_038242 [Heterodera trifolii]|uniref:RING-type domain-containing protein n=1 Tax=Heterodera trifolii TaxID=157864 RepID=A0ABD2I4B9_9BILA